MGLQFPISVLRCRLKPRRSAARPNSSLGNSFSTPSFHARQHPCLVLVSTRPTHRANMTKRKITADARNQSQDVSSPSSAKKPKHRPSRVAAQRARSALQEEAKPESPCDYSEDEVLRMLSAKTRRKSASSGKQAANTPSTKRCGTEPTSKECGTDRVMKNSSSTCSPTSSDRTERVELSGPATPPMRSGGTPSKKRAARPKQKDSAIGDYFHASPRPKKTGDLIPPPQSSGLTSRRSSAQDCVEISSDPDEPADVPPTDGTATNNTKSRNSVRQVPRDVDALEQPSDDEEPRGGMHLEQVDVDTHVHEESDDDVPDEFGVRAGTSTVVKAEKSADASQSVKTGGDVQSLNSLPVSKRTTTADIDIFELSDNDENKSGSAHGSEDGDRNQEHDNDVDDAIVKCLTKLMTRSGVQEARTRAHHS